MLNEKHDSYLRIFGWNNWDKLADWSIWDMSQFLRLIFKTLSASTLLMNRGIFPSQHLIFTYLSCTLKISHVRFEIFSVHDKYAKIKCWEIDNCCWGLGSQFWPAIYYPFLFDSFFATHVQKSVCLQSVHESVGCFPLSI